MIDVLTKVAVLPKGTRSTATRLGGVPSDRIVTAASRPDCALLYLHGGGYTVGSRTTHRAVASHLAHAVGAVGHLLDYRLAPEAPYPAAVEDALAAYQALLEHGIAPGRVVVAGDSAGGGLALALALRAREHDVALPAALGLISPWIDLTLNGLDESIDDPMLTRGWLERCADDYAGDNRRWPEVSPIYSDLSGLPPMFIQGASDEIIRDDIGRLAKAAKEAGTRVEYQLLDHHWHVSHLFAGMMREATDVVQQLGGGLRTALPA